MRTALLALAFLAAPALAEHTAEFRLLDLDGDGQVSLSEAAGNGDIVTKFDRADRNRDGRLSGKEFDALKDDKLPKKVARQPTTRTAMARLNQSAAAGGTAEKKPGKKSERKSEKKAAGG